MFSPEIFTQNEKHQSMIHPLLDSELNKFISPQIGDIFLIFFPGNRIWHFIPLETICMKCQILFSGKIKKSISKCLLKIVPRGLSNYKLFLTLLKGLNKVVSLLAGFCFLFSLSRKVPWGLIDAERDIGKPSSTERLIPLLLLKLPYNISNRFLVNPRNVTPTKKLLNSTDSITSLVKHLALQRRFRLVYLISDQSLYCL